ncbi:MAG: cyclase family protein [Acidobacteria bacterium]|nr:cyclase family protein [Acidobacteriota bacterium]
MLLPLALLTTTLLPAQTRPAATAADFHRWMKDLSNWGRWGKADERGALNLITPATRRAAAKLVREGFAVSLSHNVEKEKAPELKGLPYLDTNYAIYPEDLDAWEKKTGLRVRTGRFARRAEKGPWSMAERAGLHASTAAWFRKRDIAILGSDASSDVRPSGIEGIQQPIHTLIIVAMGTPI